MSFPFEDWKLRLLDSAGSASPSVRQCGDYVLELFWKDGCEPTMHALLDYAQAGLCGKFNLEVSPSSLDSPDSQGQNHKFTSPR